MDVMNHAQSMYYTTCAICEKIALLAIEVAMSFASIGDSITRGITASRLAATGNYDAAKQVMLDD
jgi:hypothetical protein